MGVKENSAPNEREMTTTIIIAPIEIRNKRIKRMNREPRTFLSKFTVPSMTLVLQISAWKEMIINSYQRMTRLELETVRKELRKALAMAMKKGCLTSS